MRNQEINLTIPVSNRWWISFPFVIGMFVAGFMIWTTAQMMVYPHDGIGNLHPTGLITDIEPGGPADGELQEDDKIIKLDGVAWGESYEAYKGKKGGDQVNFLVERGNKKESVTITLSDPPTGEILTRIVPISVALIFWVLGMAVQTFKPADGAADIFFAWCQGSAFTLTAGVASYLGPIWTSSLFNSMMWIIGPLSVHFHLYFPQQSTIRNKKEIIIGLYCLALLGVVPILVTGFRNENLLSQYPLFSTAGRLLLGASLLLVVVLLYYNYRHAVTPGTRGKIRLLALGGGLTGVSIVTMTILPDALFHQPILPYSFTFILLGLFPLTYGFAIYRYHLIEIDRHVNRGATYILIYSLLGGSYLVLYAWVNKVIPEDMIGFPWVNTLLALFLVFLFSPVRMAVQKFVDTIFYGGWYDYRQGVMLITQGLEQVSDLNSLARMVSQRLVTTFKLEESCAFLRGPDGNFSVIEASTRSTSENQVTRQYPVLPRSSLTFLLKIGAVERNNLKKTLTEVSVTPDELQLLDSEQIHLWVPIVGHEQILGLLALGPKIGGDVFSGEDLDILRVLARQMGPVIENLHLLMRLRQHASELEQRVRERTEELYDAKERVEAILASVGDGVIVTDLDGTIIRVNAAFEKQSGFASEEIVGSELNALLALDGKVDLFSDIKSTLENGGIWSSSLSQKRKIGKNFDVQLTVAPVRDQSGRVVSYVGSQIDITRQKELERMKDTFVADVSHELRTPTTNISLYLELLENAQPQKQHQYISIIKEQSQQLVKLVEDILDLSRLTRVKIAKGSFSYFDLGLLIDQVITSLRPLANGAGISLKNEAALDLPVFYGEQNQIARLLSNLLSNSIRYTTKGYVKVKAIRDDQQVCIEVSDSGIGINTDDLPHIFERFYRGKNVRQSKISGTGLGLAIVKEIVELHEGRIEVHSESNLGSKFTVWLPVHVAEPIVVN